MSHVVWNLFSKDAFVGNWNDFVTKFGVRSNKWLSEIYEDRHLWILISHRDTMNNKISNRGLISACVYSREVQGSSSTIQRKGKLHHKIKTFHPRFYNIRSHRAVFRYSRRSITRGKVPVPIVRVKGHTVPPFSKRLKLRVSK
ncbi:hypothetical protein Ahy_B07g086852 [Arachis hypogaea]|uniref:Protein FAR1-RELATED SEQUENCE n=1 Tax=Arachis hypogaea TaxID=3818 RepID=A0A444YAR7_ARAHY|nr:hypothetical protein Ahy_B07g086852 [Arachis hypogaea]